MSSPRHEPPEPSSLTRIYGFVTFLTALALLSLYLLLALLPHRVVASFLGEDIEGIQRIAGTIPVVFLLTALYLMTAYVFVDLMATPSLDDYNLISDKHARPWGVSSGETPVIADMPKVLWSRKVVEARKRKTEKSS